MKGGGRGGGGRLLRQVQGQAEDAEREGDNDQEPQESGPGHLSRMRDEDVQVPAYEVRVSCSFGCFLGALGPLS